MVGLKSLISDILRRLLKNVVYTDRSTVAAGLKRRGDFGFIPRKPSKEAAFLAGFDMREKNVYDIGGFIGLVTLHFAREAGSVTTFEPNPGNALRIIDHVELNGFQNVRVLQLGLGSAPGELDLAVDPAHMARGTLEPAKQRTGDQRFKVPVDTLDNVIRDGDLPEPDFIKIDTEGYELEVLKGMDETIRRHRPAIHMELHGVKEQEVAGLLLSYGYELLQVEDQSPITEDQLDLAHGHLYAAWKHAPSMVLSSSGPSLS